MKRSTSIPAVLLTCACALATQFAMAATKLRLIYGDEWSPAGRAVKKTLSSSEFRTASKGRFVIECVDAKSVRNFGDAAVSRKLPAVMCLSDKGQCFFVLDNVPQDISARKLADYAGRADAIREEAEKNGFKTVDDYGRFLQKMERYVGGPWRIVSKGFYDDYFEKMKQLDPGDKSGWIRHFELGKKVEVEDQWGKMSTDGGWKADGLGIVIKANNYRERSKFSDGEAYLREQEKLPREHLSTEQAQSLRMARFALYREDMSKRDEMIKLLQKVAGYDETTFWGTAAVGWLNTLGVPPLSAYWGWHSGDFKGPKLNQTVRYGVGHYLAKPGRYKIRFQGENGTMPRIDAIQLFKGKAKDLAEKELVAKLDKPQVSGNEVTFEFVLQAKDAKGAVNAMLVTGTADNAGNSSGKILIERKVLKDRKDATGGLPSLTGGKNGAVVASYIAKTVGKDTLMEIGKKEGGVQFLKKFFGDAEWMEQFAGSGTWESMTGEKYRVGVLNDDPLLAANALKRLDLLVWNDKDDFISTKVGRNIATALALSHPDERNSWTAEKLVLAMECYREWTKDGTLHASALTHDVRQWREVLGFGQNSELPIENLRWIHDFANLPEGAYYGLCWSCDYRLWNCFGASVHGSDYYRPWAHRWNTEELRYRVGGVCGGLSKFGSHGAASHGVRSFTAGEPGHCAYVLWDYPADRWGIAYTVTAHTQPHNTLGAIGFAALEEQNRYYTNPKRMEAERLRWKGEYGKSMRTCPGNFHAGLQWYNELAKKNAPQEDWENLATTICETFDGHPSQGWALMLACLDKISARDRKLAAAKKALTSIRESKEKTFQNPYWDEIALTPLGTMFKDDEPALWQIFGTSLLGQTKTTSFFQQTINWGADVMMPKSPEKFLSALDKAAGKTGEKLDYTGMIVKASETEDIGMWRQVYALMDRVEPGKAPKKNGKVYGKSLYGGELLSQDGLLKISNSSNWDTPILYRNVLDAEDFEGGNGFHTGKNNGPWAMVVLPGSSDINGITVVNSGGGVNRSRQVPLRIWLSDDGAGWQEVFASDQVQDEWKCQLPAPVKAKYIKVGREYDQTSGEHLFHLHKILVYGKKLY